MAKINHRTMERKRESQNPRHEPEKSMSISVAESQLPASRGCEAPPQAGSARQDDPELPREWSNKRKWVSVALASLLTTIPPVASSIVAPLLTQLGEELHIDNKVLQFLVLSSWQLTFNCGPFVLGPLSEVFGRVVVLQIGLAWFLAFNIGCGLCETTAAMVAFRFLAGFGGGAGIAVGLRSLPLPGCLYADSSFTKTGFGIVTDLFAAHERGAAVALYNIGPTLSPALGPVFSAFVVQYSTWRWAFHAVSIWTALALVLSMFLLRETRESVLLEKGNWTSTHQAALSAADHVQRLQMRKERTRTQLLIAARKTPAALLRPILMLSTEPAIQVLAFLNAYLYGLMLLSIATFPLLYEPIYHQSPSIAGLHYIALALGYLAGGFVCQICIDRTYNRLRNKLGGPSNQGQPEYRVPLMLLGSFSAPIGLLMSGWAAHYKVHWIAADIGFAIFAFGTMISIQCATNYMVDAYTTFSASAVGATWFLRGLAGFGLPLIASNLYGHLGFGWGNTLLALIAIGAGFLAPLVLWKYGQILRARSRFVAVDQ
ncbi:MFS multidrug transporter-like protein [Teratosphaeria destructans]|uniref:MFS multidrug transporter-like protein n=1 Tax=Teratosphaeria destructans TaxID=418781 RepID=A0A9W7VZR9_9PEZI|nr:MFS multidrug transporter-like protein [Teratosphaeria destructans]